MAEHDTHERDEAALTVGSSDGDGSERLPQKKQRGQGLRRRRWIPAVAIIATAALVACLAVGYFVMRQPVAAEQNTAVGYSTVAIARGDITVETRATGTIVFQGKDSLFGGPAGTLTWLAPEGSTVAAGGALYSVSAKPVVLFAGSLPAWRDFAQQMTDGEDVRQLEQNLGNFGYFDGDIDTRFTGATERAIRAWQKANGLEQTGSIARSDIVFLPEAIRVGAAKTRIGQQVGEGTELFAISSDTKVVAIDLKPSLQSVAVVGAAVTVVLPSGENVLGKVAAVGSPVERQASTKDTEKSLVLPVTVTLDDPTSIAAYEQAGVQVLFATSSSNDVLTVPVEALVPINDTAFGLEVPDPQSPGATKRIQVTVGTFGAGQVEVSGEGVREGMKVTVPKPVSER